MKILKIKIESVKFSLITAIAFLTAGACLYGCREEEKPHVHPLTHHWEKAVPLQKVPKGLASLRAKDCGACHVTHYEEWKISTHAQAWNDLQFQAELKKESSPYLCINCHIPLQNQQEFIVTGLIDGDIYKPVKKKNRHFDPELKKEGITCAGCHVRNNTIIGPTGSPNAPHEVVKDTVHLSEQLCISCHNASAVVTPELVCTFETGDEWKAGPYYGEQNCLNCHMVDTVREIVTGYGKRLSHLHYFPGSGIPKFDTLKAVGLNGLEIFPPEIKESYPADDSLAVVFKLKNEHAGHRLPTGDPERFFLITFELKDETGEVVATKEERIGERWEWWPVARKLSDNNLNPKEERSYTFTWKPLGAGNYTLRIRVTRHRLNEESAQYNKLGDHYPLFNTVYDEEFTVRIE